MCGIIDRWIGGWGGGGSEYIDEWVDKNNG